MSRCPSSLCILSPPWNCHPSLPDSWLMSLLLFGPLLCDNLTFSFSNDHLSFSFTLLFSFLSHSSFFPPCPLNPPASHFQLSCSFPQRLIHHHLVIYRCWSFKGTVKRPPGRGHPLAGCPSPRPSPLSPSACTFWRPSSGPPAPSSPSPPTPRTISSL